MNRAAGLQSGTGFQPVSPEQARCLCHFLRFMEERDGMVVRLGRENHARFRPDQAVKNPLSYEDPFTTDFSENFPGRRSGVQFVAAFMVAGRRRK